MKKIFLFALALTVYQFGFSQENTIKLKSGELELVVDKQLDRVDNIAYYFMSFSAIPTIENRVKIADLGVAFLEYIPNKTYVVNLDEECDNLILRDGNEILVKIIEITPDLIKYKRCKKENGPLISVSKEDVFMIKYNDGTKELIQ